ncbi:MAG TPA: glycerophosphodiester phosphodiesterase family protein [Jatrophihabitans sp.]|jgi:glycerophosphoryl diester phosphodiesterase
MAALPGGPVGYAHRGFSLDGAENSMAAFQAAVDLGFDHLETDSRTSADGVAVSFHDHVLDRVTNHTGRLDALSWQQISAARIMDREPIPRLDELLDTFDHAWFNIDVKSHRAIGPTLDALRRTNSWQRVRLAAFSHARLVNLRLAAGPKVASSLSPREIAWLKAGIGPSIPAGVDWSAQIPSGAGWLRLVDRRLVAAAHRRGIAVDVWTINARTEMIRLLDLGVDGIITDRVDVLREVLQERGQWRQ